MSESPDPSSNEYESPAPGRAFVRGGQTLFPLYLMNALRGSTSLFFGRSNDPCSQQKRDHHDEHAHRELHATQGHFRDQFTAPPGPCESR